MSPCPRICETSASPTSTPSPARACGQHRLRESERHGQQRDRGDRRAPRHEPRGRGARVARDLDGEHVARVEDGGERAQRVAREPRAADGEVRPHEDEHARDGGHHARRERCASPCCRYRTQPASVTKMGARFASSVELATDVYMIDQCHTPRSQAKKSPGAGERGRAEIVAGARVRRAAPRSTGGARRARCARTRSPPGPCRRGERRSARRRSRSRPRAGRGRRAFRRGWGRARRGVHGAIFARGALGPAVA